jgi:hypothetical protein
MPDRGIPSGITGKGGMFQIIHGVKEQQDFSNGLTTITATETACRSLSLMRGELFPPSQVFVTGNSRKSSVTTSFSIPTNREERDY